MKISKHKAGLIAGLAAVGAVSLYLGVVFQSTAIGQSFPSRSRTPYTAQLIRTMEGPLKPGVSIVTHLTWARKADASFAQHDESTSPAGEHGEVIEIFDRKTNSTTVTEPFTKTKITYIYTAASFTQTLSALQPQTCPANDETTKVESVLTLFQGLRQARRVSTVKNGTQVAYTEDEKYIPELDCLTINSVATRPDGATNVLRLLNLKIGVPDESYFTIPADYIERSPLEFERLYRREVDKSGFFGPSMSKSLNARYQNGRRLLATQNQQK